MSASKKNQKSRRIESETVTTKNQQSSDLLKKLFLSESITEFDPQKECGKAWSKTLLN